MTITIAAEWIEPVAEAIAASILTQPRIQALIAQLECDPRQRPSRLVDRRGLAEAKGVSLASVDRWVRDGLPFERVGSRKRFQIEQVDKWLTAHDPMPSRRGAVDRDVAAVLRRAGVRTTLADGHV